MQGSINLLQKKRAPVFEVSADQAPDSTFSSAGKSSGASKGIISTLTMIKEDLDDEISNGVKEEEESQAEFEAQLAAAKKLTQDLGKTRWDCNGGLIEIQYFRFLGAQEPDFWVSWGSGT